MSAPSSNRLTLGVGNALLERPLQNHQNRRQLFHAVVADGWWGTRNILNVMAPPRIDTAIQLPDKRQSAYAEYGDVDGFPIFLFHGLPRSRLSWGLIPDDPFSPGLHIVAPDRPGYRKSDPKPRRTLLDWADDVVALANAVEIDRFAVAGVSGWRSRRAGLCLENAGTPDIGRDAASAKRSLRLDVKQSAPLEGAAAGTGRRTPEGRRRSASRTSRPIVHRACPRRGSAHRQT
ncbi:MAG: alpha/beta hydrolase [Hyphomicrobiales bacterium]|nr:alpha/beta hydrolase [Hyphomicrobiales bacterium]